MCTVQGIKTIRISDITISTVIFKIGITSMYGLVVVK
jgi:hypothetical protein